MGGLHSALLLTVSVSSSLLLLTSLSFSLSLSLFLLLLSIPFLSATRRGSHNPSRESHPGSSRPSFPPINRPGWQLLPDLFSLSPVCCFLPGGYFPAKPALLLFPFLTVLDHHSHHKNGFQPPIRVPRVPPAIDLETVVSSVFAFLALLLALPHDFPLAFLATSFILDLREKKKKKAQVAFVVSLPRLTTPESWESTLLAAPQRMLISKEHFRGLLSVPPLTGQLT